MRLKALVMAIITIFAVQMYVAAETPAATQNNMTTTMKHKTSQHRKHHRWHKKHHRRHHKK